MSATTDDTWIDQLIVELRLRRVPCREIGDVVASARELLADSGQNAEDAFGSARAYAASLELPRTRTRDWALATVCIPVLGLIAFLAFTHASTVWFDGGVVRFSIGQTALLAVPVLLALSLPFYIGTVLRRRWLFFPLVLACGAAGALSTALVPASDADAWLRTPTAPWLVGSAIAMLALSILGTALAVRSRGTDEITEPLPGVHGATSHRG